MAASVSERVGRYRTNLREAGLRPVQIWVPDTRKPGFAEECRRQSSLLKEDPLEQDVLDWIEQAANMDGWK